MRECSHSNFFVWAAILLLVVVFSNEVEILKEKMKKLEAQQLENHPTEVEALPGPEVKEK